MPETNLDDYINHKEKWNKALESFTIGEILSIPFALAISILSNDYLSAIYMISFFNGASAYAAYYSYKHPKS